MNLMLAEIKMSNLAIGLLLKIMFMLDGSDVKIDFHILTAELFSETRIFEAWHRRFKFPDLSHKSFIVFPVD